MWAATEARLLREHKGRLEVRMQQLEDHNRQLEQQLQRLRQYLVGGAPVGTAPSGPLGLTGSRKVSSELLLDPKILRQRSASGGLAGQYDHVDGKSLTGSGSVDHLVNAAQHTDSKSTTGTQEAGFRRTVDMIRQQSTSTPARRNQPEYYHPNMEEQFVDMENTQPPQHTFPKFVRSDANRYH
ncbi:Dystrophin [Fasciola gigantica]|uniref:Dystrophin n=1 Tax=Fasciola gigantica TaxID=46835 RepID=A0A504Y941_FASGI|nr:Dystrophin [Fasciola gigantica]